MFVAIKIWQQNKTLENLENYFSKPTVWIKKSKHINATRLIAKATNNLNRNKSVK